MFLMIVLVSSNPVSARHDDAVDREDVLCQVEFEDLVRRVPALRPQFDVELMMGAPETA